ncbi:hypothetical protein DFH06DRAFT_1132523 [Mycena polygramma]|nr:hypothetical protein DFH06DRAFT_1132523 [Mycena polygramma]
MKVEERKAAGERMEKRKKKINAHTPANYTLVFGVGPRLRSARLERLSCCVCTLQQDDIPVIELDGDHDFGADYTRRGIGSDPRAGRAEVASRPNIPGTPKAQANRIISDTLQQFRALAAEHLEGRWRGEDVMVGKRVTVTRVTAGRFSYLRAATDTFAGTLHLTLSTGKTVAELRKASVAPQDHPLAKYWAVKNNFFRPDGRTTRPLVAGLNAGAPLLQAGFHRLRLKLNLSWTELGPPST